MLQNATAISKNVVKTPQRDNPPDAQSGPSLNAAARWKLGIILVAPVAVLLVVFWDAVLVLVQRWSSDADYHHGFLVPLFAIYILWKRRHKLGDPAAIVVTTSALLAGTLLLGIAGLLRAASILYYIRILDPAAMIPAVAGIVLCVLGWRGLRWAWPAVVFLVFMLPLPGAVATLLSHPLQRVGTLASTFIIQTLGIPAIAEGNIITLREGQLEVVRACSGLKMMSLFFAVCWGAAFLSDRPWTDRLLMIVSAPPVALVANILRITLTAVLVEWGLTRANLDHELAGWLMMPMAVLLLYGEMALWDRIFMPVEQGPPPVITRDLPSKALGPRPSGSR
ncbi:exosortase/archaeosortase family protein [Thermogutta sp.]|uniref:exosortase/archaeosortase family protein n=1 Tax=Thermogutta sp. TaxID=1962930 RepID=UPI003C7DED2B